MTTILTLAGEKGGIGKTTLAFHISHHLAECGRRVLMVDLDPQGNLTYMVAGEDGWASNGIKAVILQDQALSQAALRLDNHGGRLRLLGGHKSTGDIRNWLGVRGSRLDALYPLAEAAQNAAFDYVIIDTPPSPALDNRSGAVLDALTAPALFVSHYVLSPVILETLPLAGLAALSRTLELLQERRSPVRLLGVVPTMFDARTKEHAQNLRDLVSVYRSLVYPIVSRAIAVAECAAYGQPVWAFDPYNPVSKQLRLVARKVMNDVE